MLLSFGPPMDGVKKKLSVLFMFMEIEKHKSHYN